MLRRANKRKDGNESFSSGNQSHGNATANATANGTANGSNSLNSPQLRNNKGLPGSSSTSNLMSAGQGQGQGQGEVYASSNDSNRGHTHTPNHPPNSPYGYHHNQFSSNPNLLDSIPQGSVPSNSTLPSNSNSNPSQPTSTSMRASNSQDAMPPPASGGPSNHSPYSPYSSMPSNSSLSDLNSIQSNPISRGHSAFNFLLSKAKNPFGTNQGGSSAALASSPPPSHSNSISGGMNVSSSNHSLSSQQGGGSSGSGGPEGWHHPSQQQQHEGGGGGAGAAAYPRSSSVQSNLYQSQPSSYNQKYANHHGNQSNVGQGFPTSSSTSFSTRRPSVGTEDYSTSQVSSPTKRGFFSNISGRDRKISNNSSGNVKMGPSGVVGGKGSGASGGSGLIFGSHPKQREGSNHSNPIASSFGNPNYSKSQNDLHSNPSPSSGSSNDLPPVPSLNQSSADSQYLKSPTSNIGFSRSVDDLSASQNSAGPNAGTSLGAASPILRARNIRGNAISNANQRYQPNASNSSGSNNSGQRSFGSGGRTAGNQYQQQQGNWGEYGYVSSSSDWRASDMGAISSNSANRERQTSNSSNNSGSRNDQTQQMNFRSGGSSRMGSGSSKEHSRSESLLSNVPIYQQPQPSVPPIPNQHLKAPENRINHSRKSSKVSSSAGGILSNALGIGNSNSNSSSSSISNNQSSTSSPGFMPALPPNSIHQGFLARNSNISLTLNQLSNSSSTSGSNTEKDISKGWKPYRVILENDGKLSFYKPGTAGNVAEEVKSLFPTGLVRVEKESKETSTSNARDYAQDLGVGVESLKKGGLGTQDLLMATSSSSSGSGSGSGSHPAQRPRLPPSKSSDPPLTLSSPNTTGFQDSSKQIPIESQIDAIRSVENPDLIVNRTDVKDRRKSWGERVQKGSLKALASEFIHSHQIDFTGLEKKEVSKQIDSFVSPMLFSLFRTKDMRAGLETLVQELEKEIRASINAESTSKDETSQTQTQDSRVKEDEPKEMFDSELSKVKIERFLEVVPVLLVEIEDRNKIFEDLEKIIRSLWSEKGENGEQVSDIISTKLSALWEIPPFNGKQAFTAKDWTQEEESPSNDLARSDHEMLSDLSRGKISEQTLLKLEPIEVAQQIQVFHSERFRSLACPRLLASSFIKRNQGEEIGEKAFGEHEINSSASKASDSLTSLFSFDSTCPHFLSRLVLDQVFSSDLDSSKFRPNGNNQTQSPPYRRAAIIRHWVRISSLLLSLNDLNGWLAISTALCSRSISRLESTWRLVPQTDRVLIGKVWAPQLAKLGWVDGLKSDVKPLMMNIFSSTGPDGSNDPEAVRSGKQLATIPYFGDLFSTFSKERSSSDNSASPSSSDNDIVEISRFKESSDKLFVALKSWSSEWSDGKIELEESSIPSVVPAKREYQLAFQLLAGASSETGPNSGTGHYLQSSLKVEPKSLGNVDLRWRLPQPERIATNSLVPLKFAEPLPHLHILSRRDENPWVARRSPNLKGIEDSDGTILARSHHRPFLNNANLAKTSKPFSNYSSGRNAFKEVAFSSVNEFGACGSGNGSIVNSPISTLPIINASLSPTIQISNIEEESIIKIGNELILKVKPEMAGSNPSSPRASRRLSSDMASITRSRPVSQVSKRSSLPASNRNSVIEIGTPMQVTVKAATLERLVDVLVMGVSHLVASISQDSNDGTLSPTRRIKLSIDLEAYRSCFLATFRSLCSPMVLFEFLRKRFIAAENASRELSLPEHYRPTSQFPSWSMMPSVSSQADPIDTEIVTRIRLGVIEVLKIWVKRFSQDFADDSDLFEGIHSFLRQTSSLLETEQEEINRVNSNRTSNALEDEMLSERIKVFSALEDLEKCLRIGVLAVNNGKEIGKRKHQSSNPKGSESTSSSSAATASSSSTLDLDSSSPSELLDYLEVVSAIFFDKVHEHDLLIASEVFENQASDPLGWFSAKFGPSRNHGEEEIPTLSMYKALEILRPVRKDAKSLLGRLPVALIDVCAAQNLIVGWVTLQIVELKIGLARRQARLEKLVDAVWLCRARMLRLRQEDQSSFSPDAASPFKEATIASFLEYAITSSLTAAESRMFIRAWQGVASSRNASGDNLADLLPPVQNVSSLKESISTIATPDVGWILSCLAEVVSRPSDLDSSDSTLINFEKCRSVWNVIDSAMRFRPFDPTTMELANVRLKTLQHQLSRFVWDQRAMKEDAAQEASTSPLLNPSRSRSYRPLTAHLGAHQDKKRNDRLAFDFIEAELRPNHHINARAALEGTGQSAARSATAKLLSATTSQPAAPAVLPTPAEKKTRRMTALFRGAVRPMGLMTDKIEKEKVEVPTRSYGELLSMVPLSKPGLVAGCAGAHVAVWPNSQRSYVFHLTSQEGHKYLLQAPSQAEMVEWCSRIEKMAKELIVTGKKSDGKKSSPYQRGKIVVQPLYGVDLKVLVEREGRDIPVGLERMLAEVEARGLREQGIYRISGAKSAIQTLKETFGREPPESIDLSTGEFSDVHTISGAIKQWFRDLPEPPVPFSCYHALIDAERIESHDNRLYAIKDLIWTFPKPHFDLLRRVAEHLARVVDEGATNLMQAHNLGLIFGTFLLNPPPGPSAVAESFGNIGKAAHIVKIILTHNEWLFEPEAEVEAEPEVEPEVELKVTSETSPETSDPSLPEPSPLDEDASSSIAPSPVSKDIPLPESDPISAPLAHDSLQPSDSELETASEGRTPAHEFSREELDNLAELRSNSDPSDASPSSLKTIPTSPSITGMLRSDSSQSESSSLPSAAIGSEYSSNSLSPNPRPHLRLRDNNTNYSSRGREESVYLDATESFPVLQAFEFQSPARSSLPPQGEKESEAEGSEEIETQVPDETQEGESPVDQTITPDPKDSNEQ